MTEPTIDDLEQEITNIFITIDNYGTDEEARVDIRKLISDQVAKARIEELKSLLADDGQCICQLANIEVCDHNWSLCNTVKDRIAELREEQS